MTIDRLTQIIERYGEEQVSGHVLGMLLDKIRTRRELRELSSWLQEHGYQAIYAEVLALRQAPTADHFTLTYTTAPAGSYDGFGSETVAIVGTFFGQPLRQVETPIEHSQWQRARYGSGNYPAWTAQDLQERQGMRDLVCS